MEDMPVPYTDDEITPENENGAQPSALSPEQELARLAAQQELARKLDEIARLLRRMLVLAELSVSDMDVDRQSLQKVLEGLKAEVERIADSIDS